MNKKIISLVLVFSLFAGMLQAKSIGLSLEVGANYTNHQLHMFDRYSYTGFRVHSNHFKHMGGFNIALAYSLPKNWDIYISTAFAFNSVFINDTQIGFGYNFKLAKNFTLFFGGGFGIGCSKFDVYKSSEKCWRSTNIGGGVKLTGTVMFTNMVGIYFGICPNLYKPISDERYMKPDVIHSFNANLGVKLKF